MTRFGVQRDAGGDRLCRGGGTDVTESFELPDMLLTRLYWK
jgi:hypothetical protein